MNKFLSFLILGFVSQFSLAQTGSLTISGFLRDGWKPINRALIQLYSQGALLMVQETDISGKFDFNLELNREYQLIFSAYNYVSKTVSINSTVEENESKNWTFWFNLELFPEIPGIDYSLFQLPVAKIFYIPSWREFDYDISYTEKIQKLGEKTLELVKKERSRQYHVVTAQAEKANKEKKYIKAMDYLLAAGVLDPYSPYPLEQLKALEKNMLRAGKNYERFLELHYLGDSCIREHAFSKASVFFSEAIFLFPESDFTNYKSKLTDTLSRRFDNSLFRSRRFEYYVAMADKYLGSKDYMNALYYFQLASDLFPNDDYVFKQKQFIEKNILKSTTGNQVTQFRKLLENADKNFSMGNYDLAEKLYRQAQQLNPNDPYINIQLNKIEQRKSIFKPFSFTPESRTKNFLIDLARTYEKGITQEYHDWEGKKVFRVIINDGPQAREYLQITSKSDTLFYRDGEKITGQTFKIETGL
ncbi:MAG TPA: hypothetical protein PK990_00740 [Salinivirgaceae bacterium]|nr:hypothetical protein [Salinivirgaceae bacterium]